MFKKENQTVGSRIPVKSYEEVRVSQLTRQQVIEEVRRYAHPNTFHLMLGWSDAQLRAILFYWLQPEEDKEGRESKAEGNILMKFNLEIRG